jgi:uncharacterized protein YxjI
MSYKTYQLKQKVWRLMSHYEIRDDIGNLLYTVKARGFHMWKKLYFSDLDGREVFYIVQKPWAFPQKFEIRENKTVVAEVHKRMAFLKHKIDFFIGADTDVEITGNVWRREFAFERNGQMIASVSKKMWSWGDTYGMRILDSEDQEMMLASAIVIDLLIYNNNGNGGGGG